MDASGIKEPPAPKDWNNRTEAEKKVWSSFWVAKREALEEFGVTLENYCSGDYPMWALVATGSVTTANRGCPRDIDVDKILRDTDGHREAFQRGCEKLGLRLPGEPLAADELLELLIREPRHPVAGAGDRDAQTPGRAPR